MHEHVQEIHSVRGWTTAKYGMNTFLSPEMGTRFRFYTGRRLIRRVDVMFLTKVDVEANSGRPHTLILQLAQQKHTHHIYSAAPKSTQTSWYW